MSRSQVEAKGYSAAGRVRTRAAGEARNEQFPGRPTASDDGDVYFSADVETDGPIPGPYSMLSFAIVVAGTYDGDTFVRPSDYEQYFYSELRPISDRFEAEALRVNGLDRDRLVAQGADPAATMTAAAQWVVARCATGRAVLVAYPLSFDWTWLYWYFVQYSSIGSPFAHSSCFDLKTAYSIKSGVPISRAGRSRIPHDLQSHRRHTHHALDDAIEQAELFANIFSWRKP
jgi:hypothetical protein